MRPPLIVLLASTLFCAAGCGTVNTISSRTTVSADSVDHLRVKINDVLTDIFLHCRDVRMFRTPGKVLEVQVDVANDDFHQRQFAYKFSWLDRGGNLISSPMSVWKPASVPSGGSVTISSVAPDPGATDFQLQVRRSN